MKSMYVEHECKELLEGEQGSMCEVVILDVFIFPSANYFPYLHLFYEQHSKNSSLIELNLCS